MTILNSQNSNNPSLQITSYGPGTILSTLCLSLFHISDSVRGQHVSVMSVKSFFVSYYYL